MLAFVLEIQFLAYVKIFFFYHNNSSLQIVFTVEYKPMSLTLKRYDKLIRRQLQEREAVAGHLTSPGCTTSTLRTANVKGPNCCHKPPLRGVG